jgi:SHS family lactate transporter-like MFS transporter
MHFGTGDVALPVFISNLMLFVSNCIWGWVADRIGRRWAMIIPAAVGIFVTPFYLGFFTTSYSLLVVAFAVQGFFAGAVYGQNPSYLNERFPTEVRATAAGFCYHQGAIWGGLVGPLLAAWAATQPTGFVVPMLIVTVVSEIVFIIALLLGPETKGKVLISDLELVDVPAVG